MCISLWFTGVSELFQSGVSYWDEISSKMSLFENHVISKPLQSHTVRIELTKVPFNSLLSCSTSRVFVRA